MVLRDSKDALSQSTGIMGSLEHTSVQNNRGRLRQRFDLIRKLGQGTYGKVQLGIDKETGQEVAIKTIKKSKIETEADLIRIRREIQIMSCIRHPNIIHIYEVFENREKMVLVMEYAAGGELYDYLNERKVLEEGEARRIFRQVASAVYYCHKHKICHRDLKLENILLDEGKNAKIADFGLSNVFDEITLLKTFCGSPLYASPEIVRGTPYRGPEVDCWSLGVLLYTLVYGAMPFDGSNFKRLVKQISHGDYYEPRPPSPATHLIKRLLTVSPEVRASASDVLTSDWVNGPDGKGNCLTEAESLASELPVRGECLGDLLGENRKGKVLGKGKNAKSKSLVVLDEEPTTTGGGGDGDTLSEISEIQSIAMDEGCSSSGAMVANHSLNNSSTSGPPPPPPIIEKPIPVPPASAKLAGKKHHAKPKETEPEKLTSTTSEIASKPKKTKLKSEENATVEPQPPAIGLPPQPPTTTPIHTAKPEKNLAVKNRFDRAHSATREQQPQTPSSRFDRAHSVSKEIITPAPAKPEIRLRAKSVAREVESKTSIPTNTEKPKEMKEPPPQLPDLNSTKQQESQSSTPATVDMLNQPSSTQNEKQQQLVGNAAPEIASKESENHEQGKPLPEKVVVDKQQPVKKSSPKPVESKETKSVTPEEPPKIQTTTKKQPEQSAKNEPLKNVPESKKPEPKVTPPKQENVSPVPTKTKVETSKEKVEENAPVDVQNSKPQTPPSPSTPAPGSDPTSPTKVERRNSKIISAKTAELIQNLEAKSTPTKTKKLVFPSLKVSDAKNKFEQKPTDNNEPPLRKPLATRIMTKPTDKIQNNESQTQKSSPIPEKLEKVEQKKVEQTKPEPKLVKPEQKPAPSTTTTFGPKPKSVEPNSEPKHIKTKAEKPLENGELEPIAVVSKTKAELPTTTGDVIIPIKREPSLPVAPGIKSPERVTSPEPLSKPPPPKLKLKIPPPPAPAPPAPAPAPQTQTATPTKEQAAKRIGSVLQKMVSSESVHRSEVKFPVSAGSGERIIPIAIEREGPEPGPRDIRSGHSSRASSVGPCSTASRGTIFDSGGSRTIGPSRTQSSNTSFIGGSETPLSPLSQADSSVTESGGSLSTSFTMATHAPPIKKSPREFIIPIKMETSGETVKTRSSDVCTGHSRKTSVLSDSSMEDISQSFGSSRRSSGSNGVFSRATPRSALSDSSDDDPFEVLTAETLFSSLLDRVRNLTRRLDREDDDWSDMRRPSVNRTTSREPSVTLTIRNYGPGWRRSMSRDENSGEGVGGVGGTSGSELGGSGVRSPLRSSYHRSPEPIPSPSTPTAFHHRFSTLPSRRRYDRSLTTQGLDNGNGFGGGSPYLGGSRNIPNLGRTNSTPERSSNLSTLQKMNNYSDYYQGRKPFLDPTLEGLGGPASPEPAFQRPITTFHRPTFTHHHLPQRRESAGAVEFGPSHNRSQFGMNNYEPISPRGSPSLFHRESSVGPTFSEQQRTSQIPGIQAHISPPIHRTYPRPLSQVTENDSSSGNLVDSSLIPTCSSPTKLNQNQGPSVSQHRPISIANFEAFTTAKPPEKLLDTSGPKELRQPIETENLTVSTSTTNGPNTSGLPSPNNPIPINTQTQPKKKPKLLETLKNWGKKSASSQIDSSNTSSVESQCLQRALSPEKSKRFGSVNFMLGKFRKIESEGKNSNNSQHKKYAGAKSDGVLALGGQENNTSFRKKPVDAKSGKPLTIAVRVESPSSSTEDEKTPVPESPPIAGDGDKTPTSNYPRSISPLVIAPSPPRSPSSDPPTSEDSVSDRILRKSFYSRFNSGSGMGPNPISQSNNIIINKYNPNPLFKELIPSPCGGLTTSPTKERSPETLVLRPATTQSHHQHQPPPGQRRVTSKLSQLLREIDMK